VYTAIEFYCKLQDSYPSQRGKVPYADFTGEASPHIPYDHSVINYLNQVNVKTDWIRVADVGVQGNPRFGYLGTNNIAYFNVVEGWISKLANSLGGHD
jgi:hypothetical protein